MKGLIALRVVSILAVCSTLMSRCDLANNRTLRSPDGLLAVDFRTSAGKVQYKISCSASQVMVWSDLGVELDGADFTSNVDIDDMTAISTVQDQYRLHHGKTGGVSYLANEQIISITNKEKERISVRFRTSNDGVAFRYEFENSSDSIQTVLQESTSFKFPESTKAWIQPMSKSKTGWERTNPSYEEHYQSGVPVTVVPEFNSGWAYPALFQVDGLWLLLTESGLDKNYCGTRLMNISNQNALKIGFPQQAEVMGDGELLPSAAGDWRSPWRVIAVGDLATITESTLGTDLALPAIDMDLDKVRPGVASWSWVLYKDDSTIYAVQKRFIDYAAEMNWQYCLIDADWDRKIGYEKVAELVSYAKTKNVGVILWYNSSGPWNTTPYTPRDKMLTSELRRAEFDKLVKIGVRGLKVDFFGGDGNSVIRYYQEILEDAAEFGLLINFHGATLPRGWHRTYPNLMTVEAIRGQEFITFFQETADLQPEHCAIIPFTRNVFDPMDFTPMVLGEIPGIKRVTTNGFELALPTLFLSGIQHMAENPEGMATMPDFVLDHLSNLPVTWDETRFIDGYPGKLAVIARRSEEKWFVSGINGENTRKELVLNLSSLGDALSGYMITDDNDPRRLQLDEIMISDAAAVNLALMPNGGFVMVLD